MIAELPDGWSSAKLAKVATSRLGKMLDATRRGHGRQLPYLRNINVRWNEFDLSDLSEMGFEESELCEYGLLPGDVLICEGGEPGRAAVWQLPKSTIKFQKAIHRIRLKGGIEPRWLVFHLKNDADSGKLEPHFSGTTIKHFTGVALAEYPLLIPPLAEQRRIVAKIEELTARSRAARSALAEVPALLEQLRQSVLASAFRGDLTADWRAKHPNTEAATELLARIRTERRKQWEIKHPKKNYVEPEPVDDSDLPELPDGWCWASLDEVTSLIADIDHKMPRAVAQGVLFLSAKDLLNDGTLNFTDNIKMISEEDYDRLSRKAKPRQGDIIYSRIGARLGKARLVETDVRFLVSYSCCTIRPLINGVYLTRHLDREETLRRAIGDSQSIGVPDLGLDRIKRFPVPLCSEVEQIEVVKALNSAVGAVRSIEKRAEEWRLDLDQLDQSILATAFRGELVAQDPTDEPASVLLERLKMTQCEASTNSTGRRKARR